MRAFKSLLFAILVIPTAFAARPQIIASPDVAMMLELDLIELEGLGGSALLNTNRNVEIRIEDFKKKGRLNNNLCDDSVDKLYARVKHRGNKSRIEINSEFVRLSYNEQSLFPCKHGSFRNFLKASLWHELGHVWDKEHKFSTTGAYSAMMGGGSAFKQTGNRAASASPDPYEFKNLRESFAVNLEWFLLDSTYECRRPATYQLISEALGFRPYASSCDQNWNVLTQSAFPEDHYTRAFNISPERIYQVHYLFAGRGSALMSRWGHAMLRLVVCAPHRKTVGPECMQDVSHHLVLSYRASIENPTINYMDGLTGKYPSLMFIYRFHEILQEYGKQELRELWSVPLPLNQDKIDFFMKVTLERYWNYQGKYLFLSNNCGTESLRHLLAVDDEVFDEIGDFTPLQLFNGFSRLDGFSDLTSDKEQLRRMGYYFPSQRAEITRSLELLKEHGLNNRKDLKDYLKSTPAERMALYQERKWEEHDSTENRTLILNIQYVERYMAMLYNMNLMKSITKRIEKEPELKALIEKEVQAFMSLIKRPWDIAADGYGVPSEESFFAKFEAYKLKRKEEASAQQGSAMETILRHPLFSKEADDIATMRNIGILISKELKRSINLIQE